MEILLSSAYVSDLIEKGEIATIRDAMKASNEIGMQTFDQALYKLYAAGEITYAEALQNADSRTDWALGGSGWMARSRPGGAAETEGSRSWGTSPQSPTGPAASRNRRGPRRRLVRRRHQPAVP
jgi:hypothetical protein